MQTFLNTRNIWLIIIAIIWILTWKGYALWTASRHHHKGWFIALLIINTFAVLDIFYLFYIAKKTPKDFSKLLKSVFKL